MMTPDITIPPEAVEAAFRKWCEVMSRPEVGQAMEEAIRAALKAWPGLECTGPSGGGVSQEPHQAPRIILPLPQEPRDE